MPRLNEKGVAHILFLVAVIGVITFLLIANSASFKDSLFGSLYPKPASHASEGLAAFAISNAPTVPFPVNQNFPVLLEAITGPEQANVFSARVTFSPDLLEVVNITPSDALIPNGRIVESSFDNATGTLYISGTVVSPGVLSANSGKESSPIASIVFRTKSTGEAKIGIAPDSAIYSHAQNVNMLGDRIEAMIKISDSADPGIKQAPMLHVLEIKPVGNPVLGAPNKLTAKIENANLNLGADAEPNTGRFCAYDRDVFSQFNPETDCRSASTTHKIGNDVPIGALTPGAVATVTSDAWTVTDSEIVFCYDVNDVLPALPYANIKCGFLHTLNPVSSPTVTTAPTPSCNSWSGACPTSSPVSSPNPPIVITPDVTPPPLVLPSPAASPVANNVACTLSGAKWIADNENIIYVPGNKIGLWVEVYGACEGKTVRFNVYKDGVFGGPARELPVPTGVVLTSSGVATSSWVAEYSDDFASFFGPNKYYFEAYLEGDIQKIRSESPMLGVLEAPVEVVETSNYSYKDLSILLTNFNKKSDFPIQIDVAPEGAPDGVINANDYSQMLVILKNNGVIH